MAARKVCGGDAAAGKRKTVLVITFLANFLFR
jgi:hypothetical protein